MIETRHGIHMHGTMRRYTRAKACVKGKARQAVVLRDVTVCYCAGSHSAHTSPKGGEGWTVSVKSGVER